LSVATTGAASTIFGLVVDRPSPTGAALEADGVVPGVVEPWGPLPLFVDVPLGLDDEVLPVPPVDPLVVPTAVPSSVEPVALTADGATAGGLVETAGPVDGVDGVVGAVGVVGVVVVVTLVVVVVVVVVGGVVAARSASGDVVGGSDADEPPNSQYSTLPATGVSSVAPTSE
jgi:hypothetical protein